MSLKARRDERTARRKHRRNPGARMSALAATLLVAGGLTAWSLTPEQADAAQEPVAAEDDFNGDGYADLAVAAPGGSVSGKKQAGYVTVTYGSADGIDASQNTIVSRAKSGVPGSAKAKQQFGKTFSRGDLDGDGYGDLVIGSGKPNSGGVVMWGSKDGLRDGTFVQEYGHAPQVGDFDGDGKDDLALFGEGEVAGDDPIKQQAELWKGPISRDGEPTKQLNFRDKSEWFGYEYDDAECATHDDCIVGPHSTSGPVTAKAVGDVNGDDRDDLVLWVYEGDGVWGTHTLLGGATGFKKGGAVGDFGSMGGDASTDVGDVDGDGYDDVVVGSSNDTAKVTVAFGTSEGPSKDRVQTFDQTLEGFYGAQEEGDRVGSCVAVADVTGDGRAEVAVGISGEDFSDMTDAGTVALLHGTEKGVTGEGSQVLNQNTKSVPGVAEEGDEFGSACTLLDTDGDGPRDLAVSAVEENDSAGAVWSLRGGADGLTTTGAYSFGPGDVEAPGEKAQFGRYLR